MINNLSIHPLADVATAMGSESSLSLLPVLFGVGFVAAVTLGSIAWYNSRRPVGWENKDRPDIVPKIEK